MIGSLRGTLLERSLLNEVLVEVAGIGYRVTVAPATVVQLGEPGTDVFLYIHHHLREDAQTLYGFPTRDERVCFEALLGAHGVGPSLALGILSVHAPAALRQVLLDDDLAALCLVPGVGKKTAARLLVELKSRLEVPELDLPAPGQGPSMAGAGSGDRPAVVAARADVRDALAELGYQPDEVLEVLRDLPDTNDTSALLKGALQRLAVGGRGADGGNGARGAESERTGARA
jgi:Holliday junction DNA helicase RuvA